MCAIESLLAPIKSAFYRKDGVRQNFFANGRIFQLIWQKTFAMSWQHCTRALSTVASRPKILQNNSKPAVEKSDWPEEFGGCTAAVFGQKRQKTGRKKYLLIIE
jgi:hypothetical protein